MMVNVQKLLAATAVAREVEDVEKPEEPHVFAAAEPEVATPLPLVSPGQVSEGDSTVGAMGLGP